MIRKVTCGAGALGASLFAASAAWAADTAEAMGDAAAEAAATIPTEVAAPAVEAAAAVPNPGNNAWMMTSTVLVLLMILPGLALFYGGLTRSKNMLSTMTQIGATAALAFVMWVLFGYGLAFGGDANQFISSGKFFLAGVTPDSTAATFSDEVITEYVFIAFQATFSAITAALVLGGTVERIKFSAVLVFVAIWLTIVYYPIAHMVWYAGSTPETTGLIFGWGALDFAGGTVVHINAGVSALVAALILGKRKGYPAEPMPPHSLTLTMVGTGLLWVGWFGFNAGSELEADGIAGLAMINTFVATAAAALMWMLVERVMGHKPSALGFCSGVIAGLVAITPAAGNSGPMGALVLGAVASVVAYFAVAKLKPALGYDESLDAFGIHAIAGIVGAVGTGIVYSPALGGPGGDDFAMGSQIVTQIQAVLVSIAWAAVGTTIAVYAAKLLTGLRVSEQVEVEGLDIGEHGERAYN